MIQEAAAGLVPDLVLLALVVVDDIPGRPSKGIRTRVRELGGTVPNVYRLPWITRWRDDPYSEAKPATRLSRRIESLAIKEKK